MANELFVKRGANAIARPSRETITLEAQRREQTRLGRQAPQPIQIPEQPLLTPTQEAQVNALHEQRVALIAAAKRLGAPDPEAAVGDAFVSLTQSMAKGTVKDPGSLLRTAVRNEALSQIRHARGAQVTETSLEATLDSNPQQTLNPVSAVGHEYSGDAASLVITKDALEAVIASLSPREKDVLLLSMQGASEEEIKTALGLNSSTIRSTLSRARARAREVLTDYNK